jgi:hypothetical protein
MRTWLRLENVMYNSIAVIDLNHYLIIFNFSVLFFISLIIVLCYRVLTVLMSVQSAAGFFER